MKHCIIGQSLSYHSPLPILHLGNLSTRPWTPHHPPPWPSCPSHHSPSRPFPLPSPVLLITLHQGHPLHQALCSSSFSTKAIPSSKSCVPHHSPPRPSPPPSPVLLTILHQGHPPHQALCSSSFSTKAIFSTKPCAPHHFPPRPSSPLDPVLIIFHRRSSSSPNPVPLINLQGHPLH